MPLSGNDGMQPHQHPENHHPSPRVFEYRLCPGWHVLAGRTDEDNDRLSLRLAAPNDWWFHVKGLPGSHVILRVPSGQEPDRSVLKQAAAIAAYHSKARRGGVVPVSATRARYVSKPRGAKPGTVQIRKEIVLKVRPALPPGHDKAVVDRQCSGP
jgi:predicted ribosome quality control (RQC) complex YloA/Tae2 family protein